MADREYSDVFTIVKSYEGKVRIVTNKLSIQILNILSARPSTLTEIAVKTNTAKTTVQSSLVLMEHEGLVRPHVNAKDNRSMIYDRICTQLYDTQGHDWDQGDIDDALNRASLGHGNGRDKFIILVSSFDNCGIYIDKIMFNIGKRIAHHLMEEEGYDRDRIKSRLEKLFGIKFTEYTAGEKLVLGIIADEDSPLIIRNMATVFFGTVSMVEMRLINNLYCHTPDVQGSENRFKMVSFRTGSPVDPSDYEITNTPLELVERFAIYEVKDKTPFIVTNDLMLDILELLSSSDLTVNEIAAALQTRPVTVHSSIKKLMAVGFIQPTGEGGPRNVRFRLSSREIMHGDPKKKSTFYGSVDEYIITFIKGEWDLFEVVFSCLAYINSTGIKYDLVNEFVSEKLVRKLLQQRPDIEAREFLELAPYLMNSRKMNLRLVSTLPIEYVYSKEDTENLNLATYKAFLKTLVDTGMKAITGFTYPVVMRPE